MNILGVESSSVSAGAAVLKNGVLAAEIFTNNGLTHSQTLMPMISEAIAMAGLDISDIDLFAVSQGPGSYTGLRIGIGLVKGLAYGAGKKALGISSLRALAQNIPFASGLIAPIMDARAGQVYAAIYRQSPGEFETLMQPAALSLADLAAKLRGERAFFVGDGVAPYKERLTELLGEGAAFATQNLCMARAGAVAVLAQGGEGISPFELSPVYLRRPQAEREREAGD